MANFKIGISRLVSLCMYNQASYKRWMVELVIFEIDKWRNEYFCLLMLYACSSREVAYKIYCNFLICEKHLRSSNIRFLKHWYPRQILKIFKVFENCSYQLTDECAALHHLATLPTCYRKHKSFMKLWEVYIVCTGTTSKNNFGFNRSKNKTRFDEGRQPGKRCHFRYCQTSVRMRVWSISTRVLRCFTVSVTFLIFFHRQTPD